MSFYDWSSNFLIEHGASCATICLRSSQSSWILQYVPFSAQGSSSVIEYVIRVSQQSVGRRRAFEFSTLLLLCVSAIKSRPLYQVARFKHKSHGCKISYFSLAGIHSPRAGSIRTIFMALKYTPLDVTISQNCARQFS